MAFETKEGDREFRSIEKTNPELNGETPSKLLGNISCMGTAPQNAIDVAVQSSEKPCRMQVRLL
jgi:hypothetical protein